MKANLGDRDWAGRSWRLLGEYAVPPVPDRDPWILTELMAVLHTVGIPSPDLARISAAASAAVARAGRNAAPEQACPAPVVRVLISAAAEASTASPSWGFFVLERAGGENAEAATGGQCGRQPCQCIELYLYTDAGST
jgi:hypothetical protein